ncbi:MAG: radical SAM protein [Chitinophagales bacterium]
MCSYNAPNFLLPPQELIAMGGIARQFSVVETELLDCIAESYSVEQTHSFVAKFKPDVIVGIQGFECFEEDMKVLDSIKKSTPSSALVLFGHYATLFSEEILRKSLVDVIIHGEPDLVFRDLLHEMIAKGDYSDVMGISYLKEGKYIYNESELRIKNTKQLPVPAYELLKEGRYFEPFLQLPFGLIQSARGCPYSCNYCVRSFGQKLYYRSPEQIIEEIKILKERFKIRSLRFIDDTFTASRKRVMEICSMIIDNKLDIQWTCLSRVDTIDEGMIDMMHKSGCKRIYFGIESGSKEVLKFLNKEIDLDRAKELIRYCRKSKIETFGFFITGTPVEDERALEDSIRFAMESDLDYISVSQLVLYPGTELFNQYRHLINFSLYPYKNEWKEVSMNKEALEKEKLFYRRFYFRVGFAVNTIRLFVRNPLEYIQNAYHLLKYLLSSRNKHHRSDYF